MDYNNMPLSKEEFVDVIAKLRDAKELAEQVNDLFLHSRENVECDFCNAAALQISHETLVVKLLQKLMNDQEEMISYFIYELEFGEEYEAGMVTDCDGREIILNSAGALYSYLSERYR